MPASAMVVIRVAAKGIVSKPTANTAARRHAVTLLLLDMVIKTFEIAGNLLLL